MDSFRGRQIEPEIRRLFVVANRYDIHQIRHMLEEMLNKALHRMPFPLSSKDADELNVRLNGDN